MGVTQLGDIVYVVRRESSVIQIYTADTLSPLGEDIHVEGMTDPMDIVACRRDRQLYVADGDCIWRVSTDNHSYLKWLTTESTTDRFRAWTLSMTSRRLLVTSSESPGLRQYNAVNGELLRVVHLPGHVKYLWHAAETNRGNFLVCHLGTSKHERQWLDAVSELFRF